MTAAESVFHVVKKGETLYGIALSYKVSVAELMSANKILDAKTVQPGTKLLIPQPATAAIPNSPVTTTAPEKTVYIVKKGDTLYGIARQFNTSVEVINTMNALGSSAIFQGQKLQVPAPAASVQKPIVKTTPATVPVVTVVTASKPVSGTPAVKASIGLWPCAGELSYIQGKLSGVSIKAKSAASMSAVRSGIVISAGPFLTFENVVFVQAADGLIYVYGGFFSMRVKAGDSVRKGTELGTLAVDTSTGYFFVFKGSETIDPSKAPRD